MQRLVYTLLALLAFTLAGCSSDEETAKPIIEEVTEKTAFFETGDLPALKKRGQLRILTLRRANVHLPREGDSLYLERDLAAGFAQAQELKPVVVYVEAFEDLIPALLEGQGDVIAANMRITDARKEKVAFTVPTRFSREMIVARKDDPVNGLKTLKDRHISVTPGTSYIDTLESLKKSYPYIDYGVLPADFTLDQTLDKIVAGELELTVADSIEMDVIQQYRDDVITPFGLGGKVPLAWALRPDNVELQKALNRHLELELIRLGETPVYTKDLPGIKKRKVLRVITRNNAATYFLWKGELMGFEYELYKRFAEQQKLRLQMIVAPSHEDMIPMLLAGKGDVVSALLTPTDERKAQGVDFTRHYMFSTQQVVGRKKEKEMESVNDLNGREVVVRRSSVYWELAQSLIDQGIKLKLTAAPENMETEEIIAYVANGNFDLTIADNIMLDVELAWRDDIKGLMTLSEDDRPVAAAVRPGDTELKKALDNFFKKEYRGLYYNISFQKYFQSSDNITQRQTVRIEAVEPGHISPYDDIVKQYAKEFGFDWRLILAQIYQESRFDPESKSRVGARGLMQVMPRTAKAHGFDPDKLKDPEHGIQAGVEYLDWLRDRFSTETDVRDRMWFALASYNAGLGHVRDARTLARKKGWNPNKWFDNVERAMLLLSKPEYHKKSKHGYVRGGEPVHYVRNIRSRYKAYVQSDEEWKARNSTARAN
jgi:membrane-bound lytic murein transglycosylase F